MIDLVPDRFYLQSSAHPNKVAIVLPDSAERVTYEAMAESVARVAGGLESLGIGAGDRVATLALNGLPQLELLFACAHLGAILVPMNYRLTEHELLWIGANAEPSLVCYEGAFSSQARALADATGARTVVIDQPDIDVPSYAMLREAQPVKALPLAQEAPWCILYTGGTTGRPKGAILTHGSMLWNAINTDIGWDLREDDTAPVFTPMFHTGGLNVFTLPLLLVGGTLVVPRRFEVEQALRIIVEERVTLLFMVPTMYQMLAEATGFAAADFSAIRWAISGGAPCPDRIYDLYEDKVKIFKQGYGLTEVGPNDFGTPDEDAKRKRGAVGRPMPLVHARVVGPDGGNLPPGEVGELLLAGPVICGGYWRNPEDTAIAYDGEWFRTGDLVRCDEEGYFYIVDRKQDLIITGGENVYPSEVEEALYDHAAVMEAAVVGVPDPLWGETVVAVVTLKAEATVSPRELAELCSARLARYKVPRQFRFWPSLPKTAAGKILRSEVRRQLAAPQQKLEQ